VNTNPRPDTTPGTAPDTTDPRPGQDVLALDRTLAADMHRAGQYRAAFYFVVLSAALYGNVTGAKEAYGLSTLVALAAVGSLELGGIVILNDANVRRRLGEQAALRFGLSAVIATIAAGFNWMSHANHILGGLFAILSILGYLVFVSGTEAARRDRKRAMGTLAPPPPAYGVFHQWLLHPRLTWRARAIATASATPMSADESFKIARFAATQLRRLGNYTDAATAREARELANWSQVATDMRARFDNAALATLMLSRLDVVIRDAMSDDPAPAPKAVRRTPDTAAPDTRTTPDTGHRTPARRPAPTPVRTASVRETDTAGRPSVEDLAATLSAAHPGRTITNWRTQALPVLRQVHGRCGSDRAYQATALHNGRVGTHHETEPVTT
jgi:hypothetical protein